MPKRSSYYKYCFVPLCGSTSISTPQKIFICVPEKENTRKEWCAAAGIPNKKIRKVSFCCEDHFNLREDLKNPQVLHTSGRKFLKDGVVPRFFPHMFLLEHQKENVAPTSANPLVLQELPTEVQCNTLTTEQSDEINEEGEPEITESDVQMSACAWIETSNTHICETMVTKSCQTDSIEHHNVQVQAKLHASYRSKSISCNAYQDLKLLKSVCVQTNLHYDCIPKHIKDAKPATVSVSSLASESPTSESLLNTSTSSNTWEKNVELANVKNQIWNTTHILIKANPLLYLGIPKCSLHILVEIEKLYNIPMKQIYLILEKIRLDRTNAEVSCEYGYSESQIAKIFNSNVKTVCRIFRNLIVWPPAKEIFQNLPLQFRFRFSKVQSIIDCFEIEIEQPSDASIQSATWSDYKHCNTIKYLVSCTPDGFINFVSEGFTGRTSDVAIVERSGYLDIIPQNCEILADRGFKNLEHYLTKIGCKLARPSSIQSGKQSEKMTVIRDKQIASLRIHVERVIRRFREFKMLRAHSCLDHYLLRHLDSIVIICAGLINCQTPIILSN